MRPGCTCVAKKNECICASKKNASRKTSPEVANPLRPKKSSPGLKVSPDSGVDISSGFAGPSNGLRGLSSFRSETSLANFANGRHKPLHNHHGMHAVSPYPIPHSSQNLAGQWGTGRLSISEQPDFNMGLFSSASTTNLSSVAAGFQGFSPMASTQPMAPASLMPTVSNPVAVSMPAMSQPTVGSAYGIAPSGMPPSRMQRMQPNLSINTANSFAAMPDFDAPLFSAGVEPSQFSPGIPPSAITAGMPSPWPAMENSAGFGGAPAFDGVSSAAGTSSMLAGSLAGSTTNLAESASVLSMYPNSAAMSPQQVSQPHIIMPETTSVDTKMQFDTGFAIPSSNSSEFAEQEQESIQPSATSSFATFETLRSYESLQNAWPSDPRLGSASIMQSYDSLHQAFGDHDGLGLIPECAGEDAYDDAGDDGVWMKGPNSQQQAANPQLITPSPSITSLSQLTSPLPAQPLGPQDFRPQPQTTGPMADNFLYTGTGF